MAGCYGNSFEDRYFEAMLHRYLDEQEEQEDNDYERMMEEAEYAADLKREEEMLKYWEEEYVPSSLSDGPTSDDIG